MKATQRALIGGVTLLFCLMLALPTRAQQRVVENRRGKFTVGAALGLQGETADGTAFAIGVSGDYFLTDNISVGPLLQIGLTDDLTQIGLSAQAKYTLDLPDIPDLTPHFQGGIGFIHADVDRGPFFDADDTSFLIPIGVGADYRLTQDISLESTLLLNFTDLDEGVNDNFFITWFVGARFHF